MNKSESEIKTLLQTYRKITVLGLSPDRTKASHRIPMFMRTQGYEIIGVYPEKTEIAGVTMYQNLSEVPVADRAFVNVFRRSEKIPQVVDEILAVGGVKVMWLQLGIVNPLAEKRAEEAGLAVVSDRCLLVEYNHHFRSEPEVL